MSIPTRQIPSWFHQKYCYPEADVGDRSQLWRYAKEVHELHMGRTHPSSIEKKLPCGCESSLVSTFCERVSHNKSPTRRHRRKVFDLVIVGIERGPENGYKEYAKGAAVGVRNSL